MPIGWRVVVIPVTLPFIRALEKLTVFWPIVSFFADWSFTTGPPKVIDDLVF